MIDDKLHLKLEEIAKNIQEWEEVIQIGYQDTPDALIGASIFARTFLDLEMPFVIFHIDDLETQIDLRKQNPLILIGPYISEFNESIISNEQVIISKYITNKKNSNWVNPFNYVEDDSEVSYSSFCYFICNFMALDETLSHIIHMPLIATQTNNLMDEVKGFHKLIEEDAINAELIQTNKQFAILGGHNFGITNALVYSSKPFHPGLTGNTREVTKLLAKAGIPVETVDAERKLINLDEDEIKQLVSSMSVYLGTKREYQEKFEFIKTKTILLYEGEETIFRNTWDYAQSIIDAINRGRSSTAIAVLLGNRGKQARELARIFGEERQALSISFQIIVDKQEEVIDLKKIRYLVTDHKINWYNASLSAAMGLSNGLVTTDLPFAVIVPGPDDNYTIGIRASISHSIDEPLNQLTEKILQERKIDSMVYGTKLVVQVSVPKNMYEAIMLDINSKLAVNK